MITINQVTVFRHGTKSVFILTGVNEYVDKMRADLTSDPIVIQNFELRESKLEPYLGVMLTSGSMCDIINANIEAKEKKVLAKKCHIMSMLNNQRLVRIGYIQTAVTLIQTMIVPVIMYGMICLIGINKEQMKKIRSWMEPRVLTLRPDFVCLSNNSMKRQLRIEGRM